MTPDKFRAQIAALTAQLAGRPIDAELDAWLNREHGATSTTYAALKASCEAGVAEGWLCNREGGGIRYGRIFKPGRGPAGLLGRRGGHADIAGPHHVHPNGEIDLIMPLDGEASSTAAPPAGWSAHPAAPTAPP
jgi:hypothetical protein